MIRGLGVGIRRAVSAKLRERGISEEIASRLAETHAEAATKFFEGRLAAHKLHGKAVDRALDESFADLSQWAADLDAGSTAEVVADAIFGR